MWVVLASSDVVVARLAKRNGLDAKAAKARIAAQLSSEERAKRANVVIRNDGDDLEELKLAIDREVLELRKRLPRVAKL